MGRGALECRFMDLDALSWCRQRCESVNEFTPSFLRACEMGRLPMVTWRLCALPTFRMSSQMW